VPQIDRSVAGTPFADVEDGSPMTGGVDGWRRAVRCGWDMCGRRVEGKRNSYRERSENEKNNGPHANYNLTGLKRAGRPK
jgi:hypothetical protein